MFEATILTEPVGKGRPRAAVRGGKAVIYTPNETVEAEMRIRAAVNKTRIFYPAGTALEMELEFYIRRPKSVKREYPTKGSDVDNQVKLVMDACQHFLYDNDSQIVSLKATKDYCFEGQVPCIHIRVKEIRE